MALRSKLKVPTDSVRLLRSPGWTCRSVIAVLAVAALLIGYLSNSSKAQNIVTGSLEGVVADRATEAPIRGVSVRIVNDLTKTDSVLITDFKGRFFKSLLPPGIYTVTFSAEGYQSRQVVQRLMTARVNELIPVPLLLDPVKVEPDQRPVLGGIAVASLPNATVQVESLDGSSVFKRVIQTDQKLCVFDRLPNRTYRVSAKLEGYRSAIKEVTVTNETVPVTLDLSPNELSTQIGSLAGRFYALIIGNNKYRYVNKLHTAENDAIEIDAVLRRDYGFETRLLLNATREQVLVSLNEYRRKLEPNANLIIYYAGHGHNDAEVEKAYWLPIDARQEDNANWISADDITVNVKGVRANHVLIVSDSCYSGTMVRDIRLNKAVEATGRERYLLKMFEGKSRTLMASGGNEPVADSGPGGHSVFANAFLSGLRQMDREIFSAEELYYNFIREPVTGKSNQTPQYEPIRNSGHDSGDFLFIRKR